MFDAIAEAQVLASEVSSQISTMTTLATNITNELTNLKNMDWTIPAGLLVAGAISINPHIKMPDLPDFVNPLDAIVPKPMTISSDGCHADLGIYGSLLAALMTAVSSIMSAAWDTIVICLWDAILMFECILDSCVAIERWFVEVCSKIWAAIGAAWRSIDNARRSCFSSADNEADPEKAKQLKLKGTLFERALKWLSGLMDRIGINTQNLTAAKDAFLRTLGSVVTPFCENAEKLIKDLGKISTDWACLTKASTKVVAAI